MSLIIDMYSKIKLTKRSFIISNKSICKICSKGHSVCSMYDAILRAHYQQLSPRLARIIKRVIFFDNVRSMTLQEQCVHAVVNAFVQLPLHCSNRKRKAIIKHCLLPCLLFEGRMFWNSHFVVFNVFSLLYVCVLTFTLWMQIAATYCAFCMSQFGCAFSWSHVDIRLF